MTSDGTGWAISGRHRLQLCDSNSQRVLPAVWLHDSVGKRTTSNSLQQATARGAVLYGRAALFDVFQAVTNAVPGSQLAQFAMGTLRQADDVLLA